MLFNAEKPGRKPLGKKHITMVNINHMVTIQIQKYRRIKGSDIYEKILFYYSNYYIDRSIDIFLLSPVGLPNQLFFKTGDRTKSSL